MKCISFKSGTGLGTNLDGATKGLGHGFKAETFLGRYIASRFWRLGLGSHDYSRDVTTRKPMESCKMKTKRKRPIDAAKVLPL